MKAEGGRQEALYDDKMKAEMQSRRVCRVCLTHSAKACGAVLLVAALGLMAKLALGGAIPAFVWALNSVQGAGTWGIFALIGCEAAAFLLCLPISPMHVGIGFLYGLSYGIFISLTAYVVGCIPPFLLVRTPLLVDRVVQLRKRANLLDGVFGAVEVEPFKLIVCLRLSPVLPSPLNSYLLGLTNVPLRTYVSASFVGALPNVCAHVYVGTLLDSLADIAAGRAKHSPFSLLVMGTGLVATVGVIAYVSRIATRRVNAARSRERQDTLDAEEEGLPLLIPDVADTSSRLLSSDCD